MNLNEIAYKGLRYILAPFEDPIGTARPPWRDYSRWAGQVDFGVAAANGILGMAARSGISWGYQDAWFPYNWTESKKVGLYRTSYHILYPSESISRQATNWFNICPEIDTIPRVLDAELQQNLSDKAVGDAIWNMSEAVLARDGTRPIIYSRYLLLNKWLAHWTDEMVNEHYYWLAQYLWDRTREHAGPPTLPNRVDRERVILHQTADHKPGFPGEVESADVDWDRWEIGNEIEMHQWIADTWGGAPVPGPQNWYQEVTLKANEAGWDLQYPSPY